MYCPPSLAVTVSVWVYCATVALSNTVVPPETVTCRVSGPANSGSRPTSGDTGEGELRTLSIEIRVHNKLHTA